MTGNAESIVKWLFTQDRDKTFDIKEHRVRRSKSQNAYAWEIMGKIANAVRLSKEEVYLDMLKHYGQRQIVTMLTTINPDKVFDYYEEYKRGELNGKEYIAYLVYTGSSKYDTREMTIFIDGIVREAEQLGIETLTPDEIAKMRLI